MTLVRTGIRACAEGCCVATRDSDLGIGNATYVRPMFEVLPDDGAHCSEDVVPGGMHVDDAEYERPDRIFL